MAIFLFWFLALIVIPQFPLLCVSGRRLMEIERWTALDAHNYYRRYIAKEWWASDMRLMVWNFELEKFADIWARQCAYQGSPSRIRLKYGKKRLMAENIWTGEVGDSRLRIDINRAVETWYNEGNNRDRKDESKFYCPKTCLNFKQLAWSESYMVGCAVSEKDQCSLERTTKRGTIFICNYASGTFIQPSSEMPSWKDGVPCSGCEGNWRNFCFDGLCSTTNETTIDLTSGAQKTTAHAVFPAILLAITHSLCTV